MVYCVNDFDQLQTPPLPDFLNISTIYFPSLPAAQHSEIKAKNKTFSTTQVFKTVVGFFSSQEFYSLANHCRTAS